MLGLHWLDWATIAAYFVVAIGIGVWVSRKSKNSADFFMGGRRFGKLYTISHALGTGTSSEQPVTVAGAAYGLGLAGIWYQWIYLFATPFYWLLAPLYRRMRMVTMGDFFEHRFGKPAALAYTGLGLFNFIVGIALILKGTALTVEAISGGALPFTWTVLLMTLGFIIYAIWGGLLAAVANDLLQGGLIIVLSTLLLPFAISAAGGWGNVQAQVPDAMWSFVAPTEVTLLFITMVVLNALTGVVVEPHHMSVCGAAKSEIASRSGWTYGNFIKRLLTLAWAVTGVLAFLLFPNLENREHAFGTMVQELLPAGLVGLMIACMVAAVNSTCSAFTIGAGALFTRNVYETYLQQSPTEAQRMRVARYSSVVAVVAGVALALLLPSLIAGLKLLWTSAAAFGIAFWCGIVWPRANRYGMFASISVVIICMLITGRFGLKWDLEYQILLYLPLGFLTMILASLLSPAEDAQRLAHFYARLDTPVGSEARLRDQNVAFDDDAAEYDLAGSHSQGIEQGLIIADLGRLGELRKQGKLTLARYRVDALGFAAAWGLVLGILALGFTVARLGRG